MQLDADQLRELNDANQAATYKLFSGFIDLSDTLANLTALPDSALKSASSYTLSDPTVDIGQVSLPGISVSAGVVLKGADNAKDYAYTLTDVASNLAAQDVDTVAVVGNADAVTVDGAASISQLTIIDSNTDQQLNYID